MRLIGELEEILRTEESPFRVQLLREDLARLSKLREMASSAADADAFVKAGMRVGWTQADARTSELREPLERLLKELYGFERGERSEERENGIREAWHALHRLRMERLLGCLSTPVPKPGD